MNVEAGKAFPVTAATRVRRHKERGTYERATVLAILDEALICHLAFIAGGRPWAIPTMYARLGDSIYIHGSPASRMLTSSGGADVCLTVTILDGLVMARSAFTHSMNYRSVVVTGRAVDVVDPEEKGIAFKALLDHVCPGRWEDSRQPNANELNSTKVLRLPLETASAKLRTGGPKDAEADLELGYWAGEIPIHAVALKPVDSADLREGIRPPEYATGYRRR